MRVSKKLFTLMTTVTLMGFALTGCGGVNNATDAENTENGTTTESAAEDVGDAAEDVGDAAGDAVEDVGDAVGDVAEGVGDAAKDLISPDNGFDNYDDAHDYLLQEMGRNNKDAEYEIRNTKKDLVAYDNENKGYGFELYDTSSKTAGERVGQFYVDSKTGKIYQKNENTNKVEEYKMKKSGKNGAGANENGNAADTMNGTTGTNATGTTGNSGNGSR